jgi:hypothetical protein
MSKVIEGIIRGRTIELQGDPGLGEGQAVQVTLRVLPDRAARDAAVLRIAGSMADDPEFDDAMEQVRRDREGARFRDEATG